MQRKGDKYEDVRGDETRIGRGEDDAYSIDVRAFDSGEDSLQKIVAPPKYHYGPQVCFTSPSSVETNILTFLKGGLESWFSERAREIDAKSGLVSHAQLLVTQAINSGLTLLAPFAQVCPSSSVFVFFIYYTFFFLRPSINI